MYRPQQSACSHGEWAGVMIVEFGAGRDVIMFTCRRERAGRLCASAKDTPSKRNGRPDCPHTLSPYSPYFRPRAGRRSASAARSTANMPLPVPAKSVSAGPEVRARSRTSRFGRPSLNGLQWTPPSLLRNTP